MASVAEADNLAGASVTRVRMQSVGFKQCIGYGRVALRCQLQLRACELQDIIQRCALIST